jgi:hypothetical protein
VKVWIAIHQSIEARNWESDIDLNIDFQLCNLFSQSDNPTEFVTSSSVIRWILFLIHADEKDIIENLYEFGDVFI